MPADVLGRRERLPVVVVEAGRRGRRRHIVHRPAVAVQQHDERAAGLAGGQPHLRRARRAVEVPPDELRARRGGAARCGGGDGRDVAGGAPLLGACLAGAGGDDVPGAVARAPDGVVGAAVAVVVGGDRDVAGLAPLMGVLVAAGGVDDPPLARARAPNGDVGTAVAVEVGDDRDVAGFAPAHSPGGQPPFARVRAPYRGVGVPVAAPVGGHGDVPGLAPAVRVLAAGGRVDQPPGAAAGAPDRDVELTVAVVVGRHRHVTGLAPARALSLPARGRDHIPHALAGPEHHEIRTPITIEITGSGGHCRRSLPTNTSVTTRAVSLVTSVVVTPTVSSSCSPGSSRSSSTTSVGPASSARIRLSHSIWTPGCALRYSATRFRAASGMAPSSIGSVAGSRTVTGRTGAGGGGPGRSGNGEGMTDGWRRRLVYVARKLRTSARGVTSKFPLDMIALPFRGRRGEVARAATLTGGGEASQVDFAGAVIYLFPVVHRLDERGG